MRRQRRWRGGCGRTSLREPVQRAAVVQAALRSKDVLRQSAALSARHDSPPQRLTIPALAALAAALEVAATAARSSSMRSRRWRILVMSGSLVGLLKFVSGNQQRAPLAST